MKRLNVQLPKELLDQLTEYCQSEGVLKYKVVEKALAKYLSDLKPS